MSLGEGLAALATTVLTLGTCSLLLVPYGLWKPLEGLAR
jgi:hypothetical protein